MNPKNNNKDVVFRRIGGRIIPIRRKGAANNNMSFGLKAAAAGAAVAAATARAATHLKVAAGRAESIGRKSFVSSNRIMTRSSLFSAHVPSLFQHARRVEAAQKVLSIGKNSSARAGLFRKAAPIVKSAGVWIGASLIGSGLARAFESKNESNLTGTIKELAFTGATAAALLGSGDLAVRAKSSRLARGLITLISRGKVK